MLNMISLSRLARRSLILGLLALPLVPLATTAQAAEPAEIFVNDSIKRGLTILNNKSINANQRRTQFLDFLLTLTDLKRVSDTALGAARRTASPADMAAYTAAFKDYALAVYHSYMSCYAGQGLKVLNSNERGNITEVNTQLVDPKSNKPPMSVSFRLVNDGGRFLVVDFSAEGVWINILQRDQFAAFLSQNNGSIAALATDLKAKTVNLRNSPGACG